MQRVLRRGADDGDMGAGRKEVGVRVPSLAHGFVLKEKLCPPSSINPSPSYLGTLGFRGKHSGRPALNPLRQRNTHTKAYKVD